MHPKHPHINGFSSCSKLHSSAETFAVGALGTPQHAKQQYTSAGFRFLVPEVSLGGVEGTLR